MEFTPSIGFYLDALSMVMMLVVAFVSFLIHVYLAEFIEQDEGYSRYFAYINLFVGSMLVLVNNLLFLYAGWEGVGLREEETHIYPRRSPVEAKGTPVDPRRPRLGEFQEQAL